MDAGPYLLPQLGPIITFQQVCDFFFHLVFDWGLKHRFHQFAGKKVVSTKARSGGIKQDILGIIVSFARLLGCPS
jgi:hypothetical protein